MLDFAHVARAEEARQARALSEIATHARSFAGGTAGRSQPGSWSNSSVGLALKGPVTQGEVDEVVAWYEAAGIEPRFEVSPFADGTLLRALEAHRCVALLFENTFVRALAPGERAAPVVETPRALRVEAVDPKDPDAVRRYSAIAMSGFLKPGEAASEEDFAISARIVANPRTVAMLATIDGEPVGAGAAAVSEPIQIGAGATAGTDGGAGEGTRILAMFGATVLPQWRRRGVQQALLAARINHGLERGATLATIGSMPGIPTERNVRRMGFELAYTKVHVVKPGPGLMRNRG